MKYNGKNIRVSTQINTSHEIQEDKALKKCYEK